MLISVSSSWIGLLQLNCCSALIFPVIRHVCFVSWPKGDWTLKYIGPIILSALVRFGRWEILIEFLERRVFVNHSLNGEKKRPCNDCWREVCKWSGTDNISTRSTDLWLARFVQGVKLTSGRRNVLAVALMACAHTTPDHEVRSQAPAVPWFCFWKGHFLLTMPHCTQDCEWELLDC